MVAGMAAAMEMLILYGSQTGTAEEVAEELAASAFARGVALRWLSMEDYDVRTGTQGFGMLRHQPADLPLRPAAPSCRARRAPLCRLGGRRSVLRPGCAVTACGVYREQKYLFTAYALHACALAPSTLRSPYPSVPPTL